MKNAFQFEFPSHDFDQDDWNAFSNTMDCGAKIYGFGLNFRYRVDSVHQETFKILGGLHNQEFQQIQQDKNQPDLNEPDYLILNPLKENFQGEETLEKNAGNLVTDNFDLEFDLDPLFRRKTACFDESGCQNLLLNTIAVNPNLELQFGGLQIENCSVTFSDT